MSTEAESQKGFVLVPSRVSWLRYTPEVHTDMLDLSYSVVLSLLLEFPSRSNKRDKELTDS